MASVFLKKTDIVCLDHVSRISGSKTVVKDVSLTVEEGEIIGITGRDGSGKKALFKMICGFILPDKGTITVDGRTPGKDAQLSKEIGSMIEGPEFLDRFSGFYNLRFLAAVRGKIGRGDICYIMNLVGLDPLNRKRVAKYSPGMRRRLGIAQAIMEDQKILILDEPMGGLDDREMDNIRKLFIDLKKQGKTLLIASHNIADIDILCDRVFRMDQGVLTRER